MGWWISVCSTEVDGSIFEASIHVVQEAFLSHDKNSELVEPGLQIPRACSQMLWQFFLNCMQSLAGTGGATAAFQPSPLLSGGEKAATHCSSVWWVHVGRVAEQSCTPCTPLPESTEHLSSLRYRHPKVTCTEYLSLNFCGLFLGPDPSDARWQHSAGVPTALQVGTCVGACPGFRLRDAACNFSPVFIGWALCAVIHLASQSSFRLVC